MKILFALIFIVFTSNVFAQVHKCKNETGEIIYQQQPCPVKKIVETQKMKDDRAKLIEEQRVRQLYDTDGKKKIMNAEEIKEFFEKDTKRAIAEKIAQDKLKAQENKRVIMTAINDVDVLTGCQRNGCSSAVYRNILIGKTKQWAQMIMRNCTTSEIGPYQYLTCFGNLNDGGRIRAAQLQMVIKDRFKNGEKEDIVVGLNVL